MDEELILPEISEITQVSENESVTMASSEEVTHAVVNVENIEEIEISVEEAIGWIGGDRGHHYELPDRNEPNQHIITSITGLREELDEIEKLKTVYSDKYNVANYYEWEEATDEYGYFVSLVPGTSKIEICGGTDILGVSIAPKSAGFIGGENADLPRGKSYGLVVTSGLVSVRCELEVGVGDYVVSNARGYAKKSESSYGYKVLALTNKGAGIPYAVISLGVQADKTNEIGERLHRAEDRIDVNSRNIVGAVNVANQAYNKSNEATQMSQEALKDAIDAITQSKESVDVAQDALNTVIRVNAAVTQARAIAEDAVASAATLKTEATNRANDAWAKADEVQKEAYSLCAKIDQYSVGEYSQAYRLTVEQSQGILKQGMIYAPTVTHSEEYVYTNKVELVDTWNASAIKDNSKVYYTVDGDGVCTYRHYEFGNWVEYSKIPSYKRSFTREYLYMWSYLPNMGFDGWTTIDKFYNEIKDGEMNLANKAVYFSSKPINISKYDNFGYWYTNSDAPEDSEGNLGVYEPYTLYKWEDGQWLAVATLKGNASNRMVSEVYQTTNEIMMGVINPRGGIAGFNAKITDHEAITQQIAAWKNGEKDAEAIIYQQADDDRASIVISTHKSKNGEGSDARLVLTASDDGSALCIDADNISFTAGADYSGISLEANQITLNGDNLVITDSQDRTTKINGNYISTNSIDTAQLKANAITSDKIDVGELSAISADLGTVTTGEIRSVDYSEPAIRLWADENSTSVQNAVATASVSSDEPAPVNEVVEPIDDETSIIPSVGLSFSLNDDSASYSVSGIGDCTDSDIIITSEYEGLPVTKVSAEAFRYSSLITSVIIPNSVTEIGTCAFESCTNLTSVIIPNSVTTIWDNAFSRCSSLNNVVIPNSVTTINYGVFAYCSSLTNITIPDSVTSIYDWTFKDCSNLVNITIPDNIIAIGKEAFIRCSNLRSITYLGTIYEWDNISKGDGWNSDTMEYVINADDGRILKNGTVTYTCSLGLEYRLSDDGLSYSVAGIGNCTDTNIVIPSKYQGIPVTGIAASAFSKKEYITRIAIPKYITSIGRYAFERCSRLTEIYFNAIEMNTNSGNTPQFNYAGINGNGIKVIIGKDATKIPERLFYMPSSDSSACPKILSLEFEEGGKCTSIGDRAFYQLSSLKHIAISNSVTAIGNYAFESCTSLITLTIGENATSIGNYAFHNCTSLEEIYFNAISMNGSVGSSIFANAGRDGHGLMVIIGDKVTSIPGSLFDVSVSSYNPPNIVEIVFAKNGVCESIGNYAFNGCTSLTSITIPESITDIGYYAFANCINVKTIYLNAISLNAGATIFSNTGANSDMTVIIGRWVSNIRNLLFKSSPVYAVEFEESSVCESIGAYAFQGCTNLTSVTIGNRVTSLGNCAFSGCTSLTSVIIPNNVTSIGTDAFNSCSSLTNVTISKNVADFGTGIFANCTSLTSVVLPDAPIRVSGNTFKNCTALTNVTIGASATVIGASAFSGCSSLEYVVVPDGIGIIYQSAFDGCTSLTTVYYKGDSAKWNRINVQDGNDVLDSVKVYFYAEYRPEDEGDYWYYDISGFKISCDDNYFINSNNFKVTSDGTVYAKEGRFHGTVYATDGRFEGTVYANDGEFTGTVHANDGEFEGTVRAIDGHIGNLEISQGGISYEDSYTLNDNGLELKDSFSKIKVGNSLSIWYNDANSTSYMSANGPVVIAGQNDTSISLMSDNNGGTTEYTATLWCKLVWNTFDTTPYWDYTELWVEVTSAGNEALKYSTNFTVPYEHWKVGMFASTPNKKVSSGSFVFDMAANQTKSNVITHETTAYYLKFQNGNGEWSPFYMGAPRNEAFAVFTIKTFSQTVSNNNIKITGNLVPSSHHSYNLGGGIGSREWNTLFVRNVEVSSSDRNKKNSIEPLADVHTQIFDNLKPVSYKFNVSNNNRTHIGLIAQDVKEAVENAGITTQDFAGYCEWKEDDGSIGCGLRYGEFISLCIDQIQKLKKRVEELEEKLNTPQND